jgi:hypothetical protein
MITFHSRQSDYDRRARKNENAATFNFTSQIASSICTVTHTKRVKPDATIFKSRCSRTAVCYRFYTKQALPLNFVRFLRLANSSPMIQRSPARRSRNVRELSGKKSGEMSRSQNAPFPGNCRAVAIAMPPNVRTATCKTTRNMARNVRAAIRATNDATSRKISRKMTLQNPAIMLSTIPF